MQLLEEEDMHTLEEKEQMIMRDDKLATMVQHKKEDKAQKLMEKEHRATT